MNVSSRTMSAIDAVGLIHSGDRVYISGNAATPFALLEVLSQRHDLRDVELVHVLQLGRDPMAGLENFRHRSLFVGPADREAVNAGRADYVPISLHEIPRLFREGRVPLDVALVQTSPPDDHGYLSLGVEVIASMAAIETARTVIALVNPKMPRTHGDTFLHVSRVSALVEIERDLPQLERGTGFSEIEGRIGQFIAGLIEDGDTLQLGIGAIPDAVLASLGGRCDLGIHTEMVSDGVIEAIERGLVTGARKSLHPGKVIGTFALGSEAVYRYVHDNPIFEFHPSDYTNDPQVVARNDRMVAINSALELDLTGQVCSDSIGTRIYSGFGGQLDFIRGAAMSRGGRPIIALPSTAMNGARSRITPLLQPGAGVVTTRADVRFVVTEHGVADLFGKSLRERAQALIEVADPHFREELTQAAWERKLLPRAFSGVNNA
jgi:acyl-CoA hydrolase